VHILQELDGQQQLGEAVVQGGHDADMRAFELAGDALKRHGLARDINAPRRQLVGECREALTLLAGATYAQFNRWGLLHRRGLFAQQTNRTDQGVHAKARGQATVVEDAQGLAQRPAHGWARRPKDAFIGRVHDNGGLLHANPASAQTLAGLLGHGNHA